MSFTLSFTRSAYLTKPKFQLQTLCPGSLQKATGDIQHQITVSKYFHDQYDSHSHKAQSLHHWASYWSCQITLMPNHLRCHLSSVTEVHQSQLRQVDAKTIGKNVLRCFNVTPRLNWVEAERTTDDLDIKIADSCGTVLDWKDPVKTTAYQLSVIMASQMPIF